MLTAKVTTPFSGVKDGEVYPTNLNVGDEIAGNLAQVAVDNKWAVATGGSATAASAVALTLDEVIAGADKMKADELKAEATRLLGKPVDGTKKEIAAMLEAQKNGAEPVSAAELLEIADQYPDDAKLKAAAGKILGEDAPDKRDDIVAALQLRAEEDAKPKA